MDGDPGVSLEEWAWERSDFSFSCTLYTFELTKVFTRVYQVLSFFKGKLNALKFIFSMIPKWFP